jgi:hypothetical protein
LLLSRKTIRGFSGVSEKYKTFLPGFRLKKRRDFKTAGIDRRSTTSTGFGHILRKKRRALFGARLFI